jgi:Tfp pilus assembly protein PilF
MKRTLCLAAMLLALGAAFAAAGKLPVAEDDVIREVEALIDRTPAPTERELSDVHKLIQRGTQAHDAKRYDEAIENYRKALTIDPVYANAYYEMAYTLSEMGDQAGALDNVVRSLTIDPKSEQSYVLKGNVLDNLGFPEEAKKTYLALLSVMPSSYMGHLNLGICEVRLGDSKGGQDEMKKARDISPERPSPYFQLANVARHAGCDYDEHDNLTKFLEVGKDDPRADVVRTRLKEMEHYDVRMDPNDPFSTIALTEQLARVNWRTTKHRKQHPDTCGYSLTFEEEKEVLSQIVLPEWRKIKVAKPAASVPRYDLLLKIDDAGFIDEYIYDTMGKELGDSAATWLSEHAERKQAFEDWARKEGLLAEKPAPAEKPNLPGDVIETMNTSKVHYVVEKGEAEDTDRFLATERKRFREALKLHGDDTVDCAKADDLSAAAIAAVGARALVPMFRCRLPGDEVFDKSAKRVSLLGLVVRDLSPTVQGATFSEKDRVHIKIDNPSWLGYITAKAAWRNEPELRQRYGGAESDAPSIEEELFAFRSAGEGYANGRSQPNDKAQAFEPVESLDRINQIEEAGHLRGFVLYEVLHRRYGVSLKSLSGADAKAVDDYLMTHVFVSATDGH